ncbi:protein TolA [Vandammella animalimorsus]|uniref:Protein TolA n=1 Tax=Vandammella animalimorsus TaxID=2029117 RepID=A0A2A2T1Q7_9BURK|nr:cell envelope integrity protein TolA [Vandammella animalimorsus]PAT31691.1 protein TolA [Vandammella animalimorsus]PAX15462.1 protein TolA [Vandammella animalimorsus]PAX17215.1 protein TolA [Vandammella animalimorsus]
MPLTPPPLHHVPLTPPQPPLRLRAVAWAALVHAGLIGALILGANWKRPADNSVMAEVWSSLPQEAAPSAAQAEPEPEPEPAPPPPPPPPPEPEPEPAPPPPAPDPQIVLEQERKKREEERRQREREAALKKQQEEQARKKAQEEAERKKKLEQEAARKKAEQEAALKKKQEEEAAKKKAQQEAERKKKLEEQEAAKKKAQEEAAKKKAQEEAERKKKQEQEAAAKKKADEAARKAKEAADSEARRAAELRRMQGLLDGAGGTGGRGTAAQSSGPSAGWGGQVRAKVRPLINFPAAISGNPATEVEVRMDASGRITGKRIVKSSGNPGWDQAVLRALDKAQSLPKDNGRVHSPVTLVFTPND